MALAADLLDSLACPECKGELEYREQDSVLICHECERSYPVKDDIPIMLLDRAHKIGISRQSGLTSE